jgi:tetratricopeptide (TPR) repeat protein
MITLRVFIQILLLFALVFGGNGLFAEGAVSAPDPKIEAAIRQAKDLLDSWSGQRDILDQAKEILDRVLIREPENYHAIKELARYHIMNGYLHSKPKTNGRNVYTVGQFRPGTLEQAEVTLRNALRINPNFAEAYILLGHVYTQKERLKEAREALAKAEAIGTDDPWLHLNWAAVHTAAGELEAASNRYQVVLKSGTKNQKALVTAYSFQIEHHKRLGEFEKANDLYKTLCEMEPTNAWIRGNHADLLRRELGRYDEALARAREALRIMNYGVGRGILAMCLYAKWADLVINQNKSASEAQKYFDEAFRISPDLDDVMVYEGSYAKGKPLVQLLKSKGVSIDARAEDGSTALIVASNTGRADAVKVLLSLGANPNARANNGWTPLLGAADEGYQEVVKLLLEGGADPNQKIMNMDAAMLAERRGRTELATLIRQYAARLKK